MAETSQSSAQPTESEYLVQQTQAAREAVAKVWSEFKSKLGDGIDPKAWAKQHPWIAIGGAAVAGFAATAALVPSKEEQALRKLAELERALHPPASHPGNVEPAKDKPSLLATIAMEALALARPVLTSILSAQMGGTSSASPPPAETNGHSSAEPADVPTT